MANKLGEINTSRILQLLWFSKGMSRADLARELGLSKSTVTNTINSLIQKDLVITVESGQSGPSGGRRPLVLAINAGFGCILGIEIQMDFFKVVATDLQGEIIFSHSQALTIHDRSISETFAEVLLAIKPDLQRLNRPLIGVGVAAAGIIDSYNGVIRLSNPFNIVKETHFYEEIAGLIDVPVVIENDANCGCWGELAFRKTDRHGSFVFVLGEFRKGSQEYWGVALGLGFVLDGKVRHGDGFSAGEFASINWGEGNSGQFSINDAESRVVKDDPLVRLRLIRELSAHIAFLVNTLNLTGVVIGGELTKYRAEIIETLSSEIRRNWSYSNEVDCAIEFAALGDMAVAYGAAGMFLERFFSIPDAVETTPAIAKILDAAHQSN